MVIVTNWNPTSVHELSAPKVTAMFPRIHIYLAVLFSSKHRSKMLSSEDLRRSWATALDQLFAKQLSHVWFGFLSLRMRTLALTNVRVDNCYLWAHVARNSGLRALTLRREDVRIDRSTGMTDHAPFFPSLPSLHKGPGHCSEGSEEGGRASVC